MQWKGKVICNSLADVAVGSYLSQKDDNLSSIGYSYKSTTSERPDTIYGKGVYSAA